MPFLFCARNVNISVSVHVIIPSRRYERPNLRLHRYSLFLQFPVTLSSLSPRTDEFADRARNVRIFPLIGIDFYLYTGEARGRKWYFGLAVGGWKRRRRFCQAVTLPAQGGRTVREDCATGARKDAPPETRCAPFSCCSVRRGGQQVSKAATP